MEKYKVIATATFGIEAIVGREVKELGIEDVTVENARVLYETDAVGVAKSNLWLRCADRVFLQIGEFKATSFEELFNKTYDLPWEKFIPVNGEFPVNGKSVKSQLFSVSDCQAIVKKAIVKKLGATHNVEWFKEDGPKFPVLVSILKDVVTLSIDTSGVGLHKRGYRATGNEAPLKETLAAAMLKIARWHSKIPLIDPMCGSGTILIEAAMMGRNIAPGLSRKFISESWSDEFRQAFKIARKEAYDAMDYEKDLNLKGYDINKRTIGIAMENAELAGVDDTIVFGVKDAKTLSSKDEYGFIISNPPYGERLSDKKAVEQLYKMMGQAYGRLDTWSKYILTSHEEFEKNYGGKATKNRKLYNGRIKCYYYQYIGPKPPKK